MDYYIINYDIIKNWYKTLLKLKPKVLILDEAHYCKSRKAQRTKATIVLSSKIPCLLCLSGTPMENKPIELFPLLNMVDRKLFPNFMKYAIRYCGAKKMYGHWDFNGSSNIKELHKKLTSSCMIRRRKTEVLTELPDKTRSVVPMQIPIKAYRDAEQNFLEWLKKANVTISEGAKKSEALIKIGHLKRLASKLKLDMVYNWIDDFLQETDEKLILFGVHHLILDAIKNRYDDISVMLTGKTKTEERGKIVASFCNDKNKRIFIGGLKSAGVGLTMVESSTVVFVELGWSPSEHIQAEDRAYRIGQENAVNCHYLVAKGTIEEKICSMIHRKATIVEKTLDGEDIDDSFDVFSNILDDLGKL